MTRCPSCGADPSLGEIIGSPLGCEACGTLFSVEGGPDPFEVMGFEPRWSLDPEALRKRLLRLGRLVHPDFHAGGRQRSVAETNAAELNGAFAVLSDDFRRADCLLRHLDGPGEGEERSMPQAFLMEVMEWNETLEEARSGETGESALVRLERTLSSERAAALEAVASRLSPLPDRGSPLLVEVRRELNAIRYVDRTLSELRALRLDRAAP